MTIAFPCERCGHRFEVDRALAGKKCRCKKCGHVFIIPVPRQSREASAPIQSFDASGGAASTAGPRRPPSPAAPRPSRLDPPKQPAAPPVPSILDDIDDPYDLGNSTAPALKRAAPEPHEDEEFIPPRGPKPIPSRPKKKKRNRSGDAWYENVPGWVWLSVLGVYGTLFLLALASPSMSVVLFGVLFLTVMALYAVGAIGMLIVPFRESGVCGLMYLFVPFYALYYLMTRWSDMRQWFLTSLSGVGLAVVMGVALPFLGIRHTGGARVPAHAAGGGGLVGQRESVDSDIEQLFVEAIETAEEQCRLLESVDDEAAAERVAPRYAELVAKNQRIVEQLRQRNAVGELGIFGNVALKLKYDARVDRLKERLESGVQRIKNRPELQVHFARHVSQVQGGLFAGVAPGAGPQPGMPAGPPPGFGAPPAALQTPVPADQTVTLIVSGLDDQETSEAFGQKLSEALRGDGQNSGFRSQGGGGRATYTAWPVRDPQAFADRVAAFAKVSGVNGRTITVEMTPLRPGERRPADSDAIAQILFDLKSPALQRRKDALGRLMRMPVDETRRVEIAGAIEPMLKDPDGFGRSDAAKALAVWGGPENTPALVKALKDPEFGVRWAVLDTFKALHDPAGADAVADALVTDRGKAAEALRAMGPGAEPAVMKYLNHSDGFVRMEVCRILQDIGTQECVPSLYDLLRRNNGHGLDCMAATDALKRLDPDGSGLRKAMKKTTRKR